MKGLVSIIDIRPHFGGFGDDPTVKTCPEFSCWVLSMPLGLVDTREKWDCFERIAAHLLATPLVETHFPLY
jgi:hypothetical protein